MRELIISIAKEGKTIIISSHILDEIQKMCTHYAILKDGKLLKQGAIGDILSSKNQFLLDSNSNEELKSKINQHPSFSTIEESEGKLKITFNNKVKGSDINEFMHSQGILLSELTELKTSLEDEFLEIIKK